MEKILYLDDEFDNLEVFEICFFDSFHIFTAQNADEAVSILNQHEIKVVITDQRMPKETGIEFVNRIKNDWPFIVFMILSGYSDFTIVKAAIDTGRVYRFLLKPWNGDELVIDIKNAVEKYNLTKQNTDLLAHLKHQNKDLIELQKKVSDENDYLKVSMPTRKGFGDIVSVNKQFVEILHKVEQVALSDVTVLIQGETGTGKELIAQAIHKNSPRRDKPFICVNCAAIPETLFESELFGHEKGAFTGASQQRKGKFELANGGTLFLDEIGEVPIALQAKFLRVLQENEVQRIGSDEVIRINVRIITATNRNLQVESKNNQFRSDLFYRLNVFPVQLLPLRERTDDIPLLVEYFVQKFNAKYKKKIRSVPHSQLHGFITYSWPGNIRELENVIERAVVISTADRLNLSTAIPREEKTVFTSGSLSEFEKQYILTVLERTSYRVGGVGGAAEILGLKRTTLLSKIKKLGIKISDDEAECDQSE